MKFIVAIACLVVIAASSAGTYYFAYYLPAKQDELLQITKIEYERQHAELERQRSERQAEDRQQREMELQQKRRDELLAVDRQQEVLENQRRLQEEQNQTEERRRQEDLRQRYLIQEAVDDCVANANREYQVQWNDACAQLEAFNRKHIDDCIDQNGPFSKQACAEKYETEYGVNGSCRLPTDVAQVLDQRWLSAKQECAIRN